MNTFLALTRRNTKLFFRDKGLFLTSLITPIILLVLYISFLGNVYRDSILTGIPEGFKLPERLLGGLVGSQLLSSLLAVSCVTVSFCSNMLMVQDKVSGARIDFGVTPLKSHLLCASYYFTTLISSLIICFVAAAAGFLYLGSVGWYLSFSDILCIFADIFLLVMFGTALSSIINLFLSSQGQISVVGTIISSGYGFICGAYMPISQFGEGLRRLITYLPGTYATSLMRNHTMNGAISRLSELGLPEEAITGLRDAFDCNIYFEGNPVQTEAMYIILSGATLLLIAIYIFLAYITGKRNKHN